VEAMDRAARARAAEGQEIATAPAPARAALLPLLQAVPRCSSSSRRHHRILGPKVSALLHSSLWSLAFVPSRDKRAKPMFVSIPFLDRYSAPHRRGNADACVVGLRVVLSFAGAAAFVDARARPLGWPYAPVHVPVRRPAEPLPRTPRTSSRVFVEPANPRPSLGDHLDPEHPLNRSPARRCDGPPVCRRRAHTVASPPARTRRHL
jgi:hypothetical protein